MEKFDDTGKCRHLKFLLFLAVAGLPCHAGFSLVDESNGYPLVAVHCLLSGVAFLTAEHRLQGSWASVVVAPAL